jgi:hypothetical protein
MMKVSALNERLEDAVSERLKEAECILQEDNDGDGRRKK